MAHNIDQLEQVKEAVHLLSERLRSEGHSRTVVSFVLLMEAINTAKEFDDVTPFVELMEEHAERLRSDS